MYKQNYVKTQPNTQLVEFSSLRRISNIVQAKNQQHNLLLKYCPNLPLIFISAFTLLQQQINITNHQFSDFNFEQVPKLFQLYQHQKTMNQILTVIKAKVNSLQTLVDIINNYPIVSFVLQCWARNKAKPLIQNSNLYDLMGNESELINDLGIQIRGPLLGIIAAAFGMNIKICFGDKQEKDDQNVESYCSQNCKFQLVINYIHEGFSIGQLQERQLDNSISNNNNKSNQCGYLRRSKIVDSEQDSHTSGTEFKSLKKDKIGQCEKCGIGKKCQCNTIKRKGLGVTPKNNQLSNSSSNNFKNDPFNLGYLNVNNISRIRDGNRLK